MKANELLEAMRRSNLIIAGSACFCAGALYGWSALIAPLQDIYAVTTAQAAMVFSLAVVAFSFSVFTAPSFPSILRGIRGIGYISLLGCLALALATLSPSYLLFLLFFSVGFGSASGAIYAEALSIASRSNSSKFATPMMVALFGAGGAVFGPIWRVLDSLGWGMNGILVLIILLFIVSMISLLKISDTGKTYQDQQAFTHISKIAKPIRYQMILLWFIFAFGSMGGLMVLGLASRILDVGGVSVFAASFALALLATGNTTGRFSVAAFTSIASPITVCKISSTIVIFGLIILFYLQSTAGLTAGLSLVALGYGIMASAIPVTITELFGKASFKPIFAVVFTGWGVAGLLSPWLAGWSFDITGDFQIAIIMAGLASCAALICTWLLIKNMLPKKQY